MITARIKSYTIIVGFMGSALLSAEPVTVDIQSLNEVVVFENINLQRVQEKIELQKKVERNIRYVKGALLAAGGIASAYFLYKMFCSGKTSHLDSSSSKQSKSSDISDEKVNERISKMTNPYFLYCGIPITVNPDSLFDICKGIFFVTSVNALSVSVANGILAPVQHFIKQNAPKLYTMLHLSNQPSLDICEKEIENNSDNLSLFVYSLVQSDQGNIDSSYLVHRIQGAHTALIKTLEDFIALIACHALNKKDLQTYDWILNPNNSVIESVNILTKDLMDFVNLKDSRKENTEPALAAITNLQGFVRRCGVIAMQTNK